MFIHFTVVVLLTSINHVSSDVDPFDMFHDTVSELPTSTGLPFTSTPDVFNQATTQDTLHLSVTKMEHYRELHKVLVRILWHHLRVVESVAVEQDDTVRIQFAVSLKPHDIELLKKYCSTNQSSANQISSDSVNTVFSRSIHSATIFDTPTSVWHSVLSSDFSKPVVMVTTTVVFSVLLALLRLCTWRILRHLIVIVVLTLICCQFLLRKYNQQLAKKMSVLSQHENGPPEECKPRHLQSWFYWMSSLIRFRPASDLCATYYEQVITDPLHGTSLYEVLMELVLQPLICISSTIGTCLGVVYHQLTAFMPSPLAFLSLLFLLLVPPCILMRWYVMCSKAKWNGRKQSAKSARRREKKPLKCSSLPELTLT